MRWRRQQVTGLPDQRLWVPEPLLSGASVGVDREDIGAMVSEQVASRVKVTSNGSSSSVCESLVQAGAFAGLAVGPQA